MKCLNKKCGKRARKEKGYRIIRWEKKNKFPIRKCIGIYSVCKICGMVIFLKVKEKKK